MLSGMNFFLILARLKMYVEIGIMNTNSETKKLEIFRITDAEKRI